MLYTLFYLFLSFVASPALFSKRFVGLSDLYTRIAGYRAVIGVVYLSFGLLKLAEQFVEQARVVSFIEAILTISLGFILGFQWLTENIFAQNELMKTRSVEWYSKLLPYEASLSIFSLLIAVYHFVAIL